MKKFGLTVASFLLPAVASAQNLSNIETLVQSIGRIVNLVIPIVFALAILGFFWGIVKYIFGGAEDKDKAKNIMIWGVVAIFVMSAVWGLVRFIGTAFGVQTDVAPSVSPLIPKN